MFIAALSTIAKSESSLNVLVQVNVQTKWYVHTMRYFSAFLRKEILSHAATPMNLEDFLLSETSQSQKYKNCVISLT
jgi:hypothetical protein